MKLRLPKLCEAMRAVTGIVDTVKTQLALLGDKEAKNRLLTFSEAVEAADDEVYALRNGVNNRACNAIRVAKNMTQIENYLKERGFSGFEYVGAGDNVVILKCNDEVAIRVRGPVVKGSPQTEPTPKSPHIIPILEQVELQGIRLDFVPYINMNLKTAVSEGLIEPNEAERIMHYLLWANFQQDPKIWFWDRENGLGIKFEQVGFLPSGKPIVIDCGSVILESSTPEEAKERLEADKLLATEFSKKTPSLKDDQRWPVFQKH